LVPVGASKHCNLNVSASMVSIPDDNDQGDRDCAIACNLVFIFKNFTHERWMLMSYIDFQSLFPLLLHHKNFVEKLILHFYLE
jgi:hypothetical protein